MRTRPASVLLAGLTLAACSAEPNFGEASGATSSGAGGAGPGQTSGGDGGGEAGGPSSSGADGGGGAPDGSSGGGGGAPPTCTVADECPPSDQPCQEPVCNALGACELGPRAAGSDGGACGVCQGGAHLGTCGLRLYTRVFPGGSGAWSAVPVSDAWTGPDAPPPDGIDEAEHTQASGRLLVWLEDGTFHERVGTNWLPPVPTAERFPLFVPGTRVAAAAIWRQSAASDQESLLITTQDSPPRSYSYDLSPGGVIAHVSGPEPIGDEPDPAPPQRSVPFDWAFAEQRGFLGETEDWVVFWEGLGGSVYEYWGGNGLFESVETDAASALQMNGMGGAPSPGTVRAAWYQADTVFILAP